MFRHHWTGVNHAVLQHWKGTASPGGEVLHAV
jgi:hypothetical protein